MRNSVTKFVKENCANWTGKASEQCLGVDVSCRAFREPGRCFIIEGKACPYFRRCVLGSQDYRFPHNTFVQNPALEKRVPKAVREDRPLCQYAGNSQVPRQLWNIAQNRAEVLRHMR